MNADHTRARARWGYDIIEIGKSVDHLPSNRLGAAPSAGVVAGLAAAGLRLRHLDVTPRLFEEFDRGKPDGGTEQIDQTGDEKPDPHAPLRHHTPPRFV
jgi:hypothetical protein